MTDRFDESAANCCVVLKEARRDVDESFKKICDLVTAYMILEGEAKYEPFVRRLNEVIKKYAVKSGRHHGGASSEEDDAPYEGSEDGVATEAVGGSAGGASPPPFLMRHDQAVYAIPISSIQSINNRDDGHHIINPKFLILLKAR